MRGDERNIIYKNFYIHKNDAIKACQITPIMVTYFLLSRCIGLRGQAVKTSPFHGGNTGSIPVGVIWYKVNGRMRRCGSIGRAADL